MSGIEKLGSDSVTGRDLCLLQVLRAEELPSEVRPGRDAFVRLLVWDSDGETEEMISRIAGRIFRAGCVYACSWGKEGPTGDSSYDKNLGLCPECRGDNVAPWESHLPCPKCGQPMARGQSTVLWD